MKILRKSGKFDISVHQKPTFCGVLTHLDTFFQPHTNGLIPTFFFTLPFAQGWQIFIERLVRLELYFKKMAILKDLLIIKSKNFLVKFTVRKADSNYFQKWFSCNIGQTRITFNFRSLENENCKNKIRRQIIRGIKQSKYKPTEDQKKT